MPPCTEPTSPIQVWKQPYWTKRREPILPGHVSLSYPLLTGCKNDFSLVKNKHGQKKKKSLQSAIKNGWVPPFLGASGAVVHDPEHKCCEPSSLVSLRVTAWTEPRKTGACGKEAGIRNPFFLGLLDIKTGTTDGDSLCIDVVPRHYDECKVLVGDRMRSTNS